MVEFHVLKLEQIGTALSSTVHYSISDECSMLMLILLYDILLFHV